MINQVFILSAVLWVNLVSCGPTNERSKRHSRCLMSTQVIMKCTGPTLDLAISSSIKSGNCESKLETELISCLPDVSCLDCAVNCLKPICGFTNIFDILLNPFGTITKITTAPTSCLNGCTEKGE